MHSTLRNTKYSQALLESLKIYGHATNAQLLDHLHTEYPELSATTVHRITSRLAARGVIAYAPRDRSGEMRFDANTRPHHHFACSECNKLRDIAIDSSTIRKLEAALGGCRVRGSLYIQGQCQLCEANNIGGSA